MKTEGLAIFVDRHPGNLFESQRYINRSGRAEYLVSMDYASGSTFVVYKAPASLVKQWREESSSWCGNHDDLLDLLPQEVAPKS
jgi:hypothetical protein